MAYKLRLNPNKMELTYPLIKAHREMILHGEEIALKSRAVREELEAVSGEV